MNTFVLKMSVFNTSYVQIFQVSVYISENYLVSLIFMYTLEVISENCSVKH